MSKDQTEITKLTLNLGGKEVSLNMDQARKLFNALNELFGPKHNTTYVYGDWWSRPWVWPTVTYETPKTKPLYEVWCNGVNTNFNASSGALYCSVE